MIGKRLALLAVALILVALVFPGMFGPPLGAHNAGPKATAKNDGTQLATAIKQYYEDYGQYPCDPTTGGDENDYFVTGGTGQAKLFNILRAYDKDPSVKDYNSRGTIYLDVPNAKDPAHPRSGIGPDGVWYDPWGHPYLVKIDSNYNGTVLNPYTANADPAKLEMGVIVWSLGADGKGAASTTGNGDKDTGIYRDDVVSWK